MVICPCHWAIYRYKIVSFLNVFFSIWEIFTRFHKGPSVNRVLPICSNGSAFEQDGSIAHIWKKHLKSSSEPRKLWGDIESWTEALMMTVGWPLAVLRQGQICVPVHLYGENVEKSFSQNVLKINDWNLQWVIKVVNHFSYNQNFVPWGLSALATGLYTCIKLCNF